MKVLRLSWKEILRINRNKQEFSEHLFKLEDGQTFDYALPQDWLNSITDFVAEECGPSEKNKVYDQIRFTTVWYYDKNKGTCFSKPVSFCEEVASWIIQYNGRGK